MSDAQAGSRSNVTDAKDEHRRHQPTLTAHLNVASSVVLPYGVEGQNISPSNPNDTPSALAPAMGDMVGESMDTVPPLESRGN